MFQSLAERLAYLFRRLTGRKFLCDSCRFDYGSACTRPERPNAVVCSDYKRRA